VVLSDWSIYCHRECWWCSLAGQCTVIGSVGGTLWLVNILSKGVLVVLSGWSIYCQRQCWRCYLAGQYTVIGSVRGALWLVNILSKGVLVVLSGWSTVILVFLVFSGWSIYCQRECWRCYLAGQYTVMGSVRGALWLVNILSKGVLVVLSGWSTVILVFLVFSGWSMYCQRECWWCSLAGQ